MRLSKKAAIILTAGTIGVIGAGASTAVFLPQPVHQVTPEPVKMVTMTEPTIKPVEEVPEPTSKAVVETPVPVAKTVDDFVVEYQWSVNGTQTGVLDQWMRRWPQHFTDTEMQASFQYMHDVGLAYAIKTGKTDIPANLQGATANAYWGLLYNMNVGPRGQGADAERWVWMGTFVGVNTSRYE